MAPKIISVIGALDYDLVMVTNRAPDSGESLVANDYFEGLGGKGANAAIAVYRTSHKKPAGFDLEASSVDELGTPTAEKSDLVDHSIQVKEVNGVNEVIEVKEINEGDDDDDIQVRMVGAVGDDHYGGLFYDALKKNYINTSGVVTVPNTSSSICFVIVENYTRENRCLFHLGATDSWKKENFLRAEDLAHGPRPDLVIAQMEIRKEVVEQMIETAGKAGIDFLLNAAPANPVTHQSYQYITHFVVNEAEAAIMSGRDHNEINQDTWATVAQEFVNRGVKNVVITLGARGAYYATATECGRIPAFKVDVVDSTGAGGTFTGAYASDYVKQKAAGKWDIKSAVIRANKACALTIGRLGAQTGIPWADEIDEFEADLNVPDMAILSVTDDSFA